QSWEFTDVRGGIADDQEQSELWQRLDAGIDPIKDRSKTKCAAGDGLHHEPVSLEGVNVKIETISGEECVGGGECNPLVAIDERMVVGERLHQRGGLFRQAVVVAILGTKNRRLKRSSIAKSVKSAEFINQLTVHLFHFGDRQIKVLGHLLGQHLEQLAIPFLRFPEGIHRFWPDGLLRRNYIMEVMLQSAFEQEPLRLSPLLSNGDEFLMELGIDFRSKLYRVGHDLTSKHSLSSRLSAEVKNTLD